MEEQGGSTGQVLPSVAEIMAVQRANRERLNEQEKQEEQRCRLRGQLLDAFHGVRYCTADSLPPGQFYPVFGSRIVTLARLLADRRELERLLMQVSELPENLSQDERQARMLIVHLLRIAAEGAVEQVMGLLKEAAECPFAGQVFEWLRRNLEATFFRTWQAACELTEENPTMRKISGERQLENERKGAWPPLDLETIDYRPIVEALGTALTTARRFQAWNHDGSIGRTGNNLLLKLNRDLHELQQRVADVGLDDLSRMRRGSEQWRTAVKALQDLCFDQKRGKNALSFEEPAFLRRLEVAADMVQEVVESVRLPSDPTGAPSKSVDVAKFAKDTFKFSENAEVWERKFPREQAPCVVLGDRGGHPIVLGREKEPLTIAQYDVLSVLLAAGAKGLTKDKLVQMSKREDARGILDRLRKKDADWRRVIQFPGKPGRGYRIPS